MVDTSSTGERPVSGVCPWCSAPLTPPATVCPSCGANLVADGDPNVPGVTAIDAAALVRSKVTPQPRNRLLSWLSGDDQADQPSKADIQAIAPPDDEVRREILRLELEAHVANLQAEADAIRAEAVAEGRTIDLPDVAAAGSGEGGPAGDVAEGGEKVARGGNAVPAGEAGGAAPVVHEDEPPA